MAYAFYGWNHGDVPAITNEYGLPVSYTMHFQIFGANIPVRLDCEKNGAKKTGL